MDTREQNVFDQIRFEIKMQKRCGRCSDHQKIIIQRKPRFEQEDFLKVVSKRRWEWDEFVLYSVGSQAWSGPETDEKNMHCHRFAVIEPAYLTPLPQNFGKTPATWQTAFYNLPGSEACLHTRYTTLLFLTPWAPQFQGLWRWRTSSKNWQGSCHYLMFYASPRSSGSYSSVCYFFLIFDHGPSFGTVSEIYTACSGALIKNF